jgi:hypothetical protein
MFIGIPWLNGCCPISISLLGAKDSKDREPIVPNWLQKLRRSLPRLVGTDLTGKPQESITNLMDGRCRNDWNGWQVQNEDVTICDLCQVFGNPFSFRA